jgi:Subtilase family/Secretion system C-terminal sorting domain
MFDTADIDFKGRILSSTFASTIISGHASSMATIIAGGGNTWNYTKGAAWRSTISSASFANLLPEPLPYYQSNNIRLQNHSYGTLVEHFYGAEATSYDASVNSIPSLVHIFSIGNSGTFTPAAGRYNGIAATANITGNFKQAKNIITVGHADSFYNVLPPSSRGPAFDGRIKPELVAFGEDGSSGAAALVSGIALVVQDAHQQLYGSLPNASLIKSVLLNSADDVAATGIDFASGYGNANGYKAVQTILRNRFFNGSVSNNTSQLFNIPIPSGIKQLKLTLSWTDAPAAPNSSKALVNDLDLELMNNTTLQSWLPWVLNSFPNKDSLQLLPVRKKDTLNNTEQISIDNPAAGNYTITVKGSSITTATQNYSIAWQTDSVNTFKWYYPGKNDHLLPPDTNVLRWQSTFASNGDLEISLNNGSSWLPVANNIDLSKGFYKYSTPQLNQAALLRMKIGADFFVSDTFTISQRVAASVGFNCDDSVMIQWQRMPGVNQYRIYELGNQYLQSVKTTTDTFYVFAKTSTPAVHFAIAPLQSNKELVRSYTFNYNTQGSGCYIRSFLADLTINNEARLQLTLSSTLRVKRIGFQKRNATGLITIYTITAITGVNYLHLDASLINGTNIYRAFVELTDGRMIYSDEAYIYFLGNKQVVLYPNPVLRSSPLQILSKPEDELTIHFFNSNGMMILEQKLNDVPELINTNLFSKGIYYYRVVNKEKQRVKSGSVVVY